MRLIFGGHLGGPRTARQSDDVPLKLGKVKCREMQAHRGQDAEMTGNKGDLQGKRRGTEMGKEQEMRGKWKGNEEKWKTVKG